MNINSLNSVWFQTEISLKPVPRGCHLVTDQVLECLTGTRFSTVKIGWTHVFIKHTSASLTLNENADPSVRRDMEIALNHICPEDLPFIHTMEGADDMPAHVKASMMGSSITIPVTNGRFNLGTWQGIYLCEHRNRGGSRNVVVTVFGQSQVFDSGDIL